MATREFTVSCLCAEWCDVCCGYREGFLGLAERFPQAQFDWVDIEALEDDIEVDNFPTIVVTRGEQALFRGVIRADPEQLARLLKKLMA